MLWLVRSSPVPNQIDLHRKWPTKGNTCDPDNVVCEGAGNCWPRRLHSTLTFFPVQNVSLQTWSTLSPISPFFNSLIHSSVYIEWGAFFSQQSSGTSADRIRTISLWFKNMFKGEHKFCVMRILKMPKLQAALEYSLQWPENPSD